MQKNYSFIMLHSILPVTPYSPRYILQDQGHFPCQQGLEVINKVQESSVGPKNSQQGKRGISRVYEESVEPRSTRYQESSAGPKSCQQALAADSLTILTKVTRHQTLELLQCQQAQESSVQHLSHQQGLRIIRSAQVPVGVSWAQGLSVEPRNSQHALGIVSRAQESSVGPRSHQQVL